ncbi:uncharacterized protein NECHADRAFT_82873 [Fusarium vanettenii 77-13-4]|uniref:Uncharacterized protein n=1 Tax=Fusarium vanettenii (strain ATCC MYA-4622 / CBS 123669 / FGSC 9596 / NRRL 45880 / 77-13-4) TaxID=660122 RepID=C7YX30_FUSV7|nr:uncharacterized protein NECHADRAFT_82873 [Fusarium vanettenii 77-13-4]EEU43761.1 predicted protein [Fusarium vanettenii 77-13-4]
MDIPTTSAAAASVASRVGQAPTPYEREILTALGHYPQGTGYRRRYVRASRRIFDSTDEWPWEWAADFLPNKPWGYCMLEEIARTLDELDRRSTEANSDSNAETLREFLRNRARERDQSDPHLIPGDVRKAMEHFGVKRNAKRTTEAPNDSEVNGEEGRSEDHKNANNGFTGGNDNQQGETQNEVDAAGSTSPVTAGNRKRPGEAFDNSQTRKSARRDEPEHHGGPALDGPAQTMPQTEGLIDLVGQVQFPVTDEKPLAPFLSNIVSTIEDQRAATRMTLNGIKDQLNAARFSMRARDTSLNELAQDGVTTQRLEELRWAFGNTIEAKRDIQRAKTFFERHQAELALDALLASQVAEQYETRLRECDEGIAHAEADLRGMEEAYTAKCQEWERLKSLLRKDQERVRHLEVSHEHFTLQLEYYRTIGDMTKLGAYGVASLTKRLAENGIALFTATKDSGMKNESSVDSAS